MKEVVSFGKLVALEPIKNQQAAKAKKIAGMSIIDEKVELLPLNVMFPYAQLKVGDKAYIDGNNALNHPWAKNVYNIGEVEFILVPEQFILLVETEPYVPYFSTLKWDFLNNNNYGGTFPGGQFYK